ncbi:MAG: DGQHR domain-containing protein [Gaiellaceae bacterium]
MERDFVSQRFGSKIVLGPCVVGQNIDNVCLEGFASIDQLAAISSPDIFDDEINPTGTQRELKQPHANASFAFASSNKKEGEENTRVFPDVILNVRDMLAVELRSWPDDAALDFDSHTPVSDVGAQVVSVVVDLDNVEFPKTNVGPEVSRVDGNHRLDGWDRYLLALSDGNEVEQVDVPSVPFMLFLNLSLPEELKIFNDFNGKHEGMEPSLLLTQIVRLGSKEELVADPAKLPSWVAYELTRSNRAFNGITFIGGSKKGAQEAAKKLRVTLSAVRSAVNVILRNSHRLRETLADQPDAILTIIDNYWTAISKTFPEAWENKRDFILLQSIGLNGFAEYGAGVIDTAGASIEVSDFQQILESIKDNITLERSAAIYNGVAGAGGAKRVAQLLRDASTEESLLKQKILQKVGTSSTDEEKIEAVAAEVSSGGAGDGDTTD